jgi:hypothetical protein
MEPTPETTTTPAEVTTTDTTPIDYAALYEAERAKNARLKADVDKHRTRAQTVEEEKLQKASLEEQLTTYKQRAEDAERKAQEAELARVQSAREASLIGRVADAKKALRLLDPEKHLDEDGNVRVDAFLADNPFMAFKSAGVTIPGPHSTAEPNVLKPEDFVGKPAEWRAQNIHRLKPA